MVVTEEELVLFSNPTGSGKATTFKLNYLNIHRPFPGLYFGLDGDV